MRTPHNYNWPDFKTNRSSTIETLLWTLNTLLLPSSFHTTHLFCHSSLMFEIWNPCYTKEAVPFWSKCGEWVMEIVCLQSPFNGMFLLPNEMSPRYHRHPTIHMLMSSVELFICSICSLFSSCVIWNYAVKLHGGETIMLINPPLNLIFKFLVAWLVLFIWVIGLVYCPACICERRLLI